MKKSKTKKERILRRTRRKKHTDQIVIEMFLKKKKKKKKSMDEIPLKNTFLKVEQKSNYFTQIKQIKLLLSSFC